MNVTATNAATILEEWPELVRRCEFYTVDQEMTGIDGDGPLDRTAGLDVNYKNVSHAVKKYCAFQFGICLFERRDGKAYDLSKVGSDSDYIVRPFSFWLLNDNTDITLSTSAVKFLLSNKMNYQFWLENGLEYGTTDQNACPSFEDLNEAEQKWVTEQFEGINKWYDNPPVPVEADSASESAASTKTPVVSTPATAESPTVASPSTEVEPAKKSDKKADKDEYFLETYVSARADVYLHYLLYAQTSYIPRGHAVPEAIKSKLGRQGTFNALSTKLLTANRDPRYPRAWIARLDKDISTQSLRTKVTFHPFFKALIDSRKPHIGHNYFTDLMFELHQHHFSLPDEYKDFRKVLATTFPTLYDTKVLGQLVGAPSKHSDLGSMFKDYSEKGRKAGVYKKFKFPMGFSDFSRTDLQCAHDGSYDAFMTGVVFLYAISTSGTKAGIEEGYDKYEGIIAQFASSFWAALRREEDLPGATEKVQAIIMGRPVPTDEEIKKLREAANGKEKK